MFKIKRYFLHAMWTEPKRTPAIIIFLVWMIYACFYVPSEWWNLPIQENWNIGHTIGALLFVWTCSGISKITEELRLQRKFLFILLGEIADLNPEKSRELKSKYYWLSDENDYQERLSGYGSNY